MPILDPRTVSVARTLLILALLVLFVYGARHTLIACLMAIFFAYLVSPLVSRVERWRRISRGSRALAIAEVYVILALIVTALILGIGPRVAADGRQLISAAPSLFDKLGSGEIVHKIGFTRGWSYETQVRAEHLLVEHKDAVLAWIKQFGLQVGALVAQVFWIVLIPILAIPFLKDAPEIVEFIFSALRLRPQARTFAEVVLQDVNSMAANYIRTQLTLAALAIVAYTVVLVALGMQYGIVLGVVGGALEFIPVGWSRDRRSDDFRGRPSHRLSSSDFAGCISRLLAPVAGLLQFPPFDARERPPAALCRHFRSSRRRGNRRFSWSVSLYSGSGYCSHYLAKLACLLRTRHRLQRNATGSAHQGRVTIAL